MDESEYNSQIEKIASLMTDDKLSPDEQAPEKLKNIMIMQKQISNTMMNLQCN